MVYIIIRRKDTIFERWGSNMCGIFLQTVELLLSELMLQIFCFIVKLRYIALICVNKA